MWWLLACGGPSDVERLAAALEGPPDPAACARIEDLQMGQECTWDAAVRLSDAGACGSLGGAARDECVFRVAEARGSLEACAGAGALVVDCQRHVFGRMGHAVAEDAALAEVVPALEIGAFEPDATCWRDFMLSALSVRRLVRSSDCQGLEGLPAGACAATVVEIQDRYLENARTRGQLCEGPLGGKLAELEDDPGFGERLATARGADCSGKP